MPFVIGFGHFSVAFLNQSLSLPKICLLQHDAGHPLLRVLPHPGPNLLHPVVDLVSRTAQAGPAVCVRVHAGSHFCRQSGCLRPYHAVARIDW